MGTLPELWRLADLIGEPAPAADADVRELLSDPQITPAAREVLNAAFLIAGHADSTAVSEAGVPADATLIARARTLLAGANAKDFADSVMRGVDRGRIRTGPGGGRALDLSYERLFSLSRTERQAQFSTPVQLLDRFS